MKQVVAYVGTVLVALAASACCWIPVLFGVGAASSLGLSAALAPWRPYLLGLTMVFLGFGFWMVYRKPNATCEGDSCCSVAALKRRKKNIGVMWVVAFATIATSTYPSWGAIGATTAVAQASYLSTSTKQLVLNVPSMDCAACAQPILSATTKIPGVVSASVDVDKKTAAVVVKSDFKGKEELLWAVKAAGFEATLEGNTR